MPDKVHSEFHACPACDGKGTSQVGCPSGRSPAVRAAAAGLCRRSGASSCSRKLRNFRHQGQPSLKRPTSAGASWLGQGRNTAPRCDARARKILASV